jgi:S-formylglutathione hydrolase FrmB
VSPGPLANCWKFLYPPVYFRGFGDTAAIAQMTRSVMRQRHIDPQRVYAVGASAGGLMTSALAAVYPELYAAVGIVESAGYMDGFCFTSGTGLPAEVSAQLARVAMGSNPRVVPRFVIGSTGDLAFPQSCAKKALQQGLRTNNLVISGSQTGPISLSPASVRRQQVPKGRSYTVSTYRDPNGCVVGEQTIIDGMPHAWPGGSSHMGGYSDPTAPDGATIAWDFLKRFTKRSTAMPCAEAEAPHRAHVRQGSKVRVTKVERIGKRLVRLTISTPAFAGPTGVDVDLPVGYAAHPHKRWPVSYFLAGTMNTYKSFNSVVDGLKLTRHFPSIVVSPNGDSGYWSDWYNSGRGGAPKYETYVIRQLIPLIDKMFRTIPKRSMRAVAGVSMGGYGSMMMAARHPDLFANAATISGAVNSNIPPLAAAVTASSTFQGGAPDAIYGPRLTEAVRWHGHNPWDLAMNLRGLNLQVRTANGFPNPGIGENLLSADSVSCVIESGVYGASVEFHERLDRLGIRHYWRDYGAGCHTPPNFVRQTMATIKAFTKQFRHPSPRPKTFDYRSIDPSFKVYGWTVRADQRRALEFLYLRHAGRHGITVTGSGRTTVTTPPLFRGMRKVRLYDAVQHVVRPDRAGRISFAVDLGPADTAQQYTLGAVTREVSRTVTFTPVD